jgi:hypothetical protein
MQVFSWHSFQLNWHRGQDRAKQRQVRRNLRPFSATNWISMRISRPIEPWIWGWRIYCARARGPRRAARRRRLIPNYGWKASGAGMPYFASRRHPLAVVAQSFGPRMVCTRCRGIVGTDAPPSGRSGPRARVFLMWVIVRPLTTSDNAVAQLSQAGPPGQSLHHVATLWRFGEADNLFRYRDRYAGAFYVDRAQGIGGRVVADRQTARRRSPSGSRRGCPWCRRPPG